MTISQKDAKLPTLMFGLGSHNKPSIEDLKARAKQIRRDIVQMTGVAGSGHPGGSLSATDILVVLYQMEPE